MALNTGANQFTDPTFSAKACFIVAGDLTTIVNKGKRAGPMSGLINRLMESEILFPGIEAG